MKPKSVIFSVIIFLTLNLATSLASTYLQADLKLKEGVKGDSANFVTVDERKIEVKEGVKSTLFMGNFTLDLGFQKIDTTSLSLNLTLLTLAPDLERIFREPLIGIGHTYSIKDIKLKGKRVFNLELTPSGYIEKEDSCNYLLTDSLWLYNNKVIHFAITYMENSLADYFFNMNRKYLELDYKKIKHYFKFSYPQTLKIDYFICPCEIPEAIWDPRLNLSLDPSKHKIYVLFDKDKESVDFPGPLLLLLYEYWGYSPAFVAEGASGYLGMSYYNAKKLKEKGELIPLSRLKISKDYRQAPADKAFIEASSFISYLIDAYNMDTFRKFYTLATDLTFDQAFKEVYSKTLVQMEKDWLSFLDRYKPLEDELVSLADREVNFRYYNEAIEPYKDALKIYAGYSEQENILRIMNKLAGAYFSTGDYESTRNYYRQMTLIDTLNPGDHYILGNLYLLQGQKDSAQTEYLKAIKLDTNFASPWVKLGRILLDEGQLDRAKEDFEKAKKLNPSALNWVEICSGLAKVYSEKKDTSKAQQNLYSALQYSNYYLSSQKTISADPYLKIGEIYLSLGETDSALVPLKLAEFLEDRPAYLGEIYLKLGQAYQQKGEKDKAKAYFQQVLLIPSGMEEKRLAQERLKSVD
jgi:tetratricopeptide (TPR) repeat protein